MSKRKDTAPFYHLIAAVVLPNAITIICLCQSQVSYKSKHLILLNKLLDFLSMPTRILTSYILKTMHVHVYTSDITHCHYLMKQTYTSTTLFVCLFVW